MFGAGRGLGDDLTRALHSSFLSVDRYVTCRGDQGSENWTDTAASRRRIVGKLRTKPDWGNTDVICLYILKVPPSPLRSLIPMSYIALHFTYDRVSSLNICRYNTIRYNTSVPQVPQYMSRVSTVKLVIDATTLICFKPFVKTETWNFLFTQPWRRKHSQQTHRHIPENRNEYLQQIFVCNRITTTVTYAMCDELFNYFNEANICVLTLQLHIRDISRNCYCFFVKCFPEYGR